MSKLDWLDEIPLPERADTGDSTASPSVPSVAVPEVQARPQPMPISLSEPGGPDMDFRHPPADSPTRPSRLESASVIFMTQEEHMHPYEEEPQSRSWTPVQVITLLVVLGIIVVWLGMIFQDSIRDKAKGWAEIQETKRIEAERQVQYAALESNVVQTIRGIDERLNQLKLDTNALAARVEECIGAPLKHLAQHPEERPKYLDQAIYDSPTIAAHWAAVSNAIMAEYPPSKLRLALEAVRTRIDTKELLPADRQVLVELLTYVEQEERFSQQRSRSVEELVRLMEARRFEDDLERIERSR